MNSCRFTAAGSCASRTDSASEGLLPLGITASTLALRFIALCADPVSNRDSWNDIGMPASIAECFIRILAAGRSIFTPCCGFTLAADNAWSSSVRITRELRFLLCCSNQSCCNIKSEVKQCPSVDERHSPGLRIVWRADFDHVPGVWTACPCVYWTHLHPVSA
jgi:hypothetical protein